MNFFEIVGSNILKVLEEKSLTQSQLAEKIGVSRQVLQKIVKGKKAINALEVTKIAEALGVSVESLMEPKAQKIEEDQVVLFMGTISNQKVKKQFDFLNEIIEEIVQMEEELHEKSR